MIKPLIISLVTITSVNCFGKTAKMIDADRSLVLRGAINGSIIDGIPKLQALAEESLEPIHLLINSPGGAVLPGMMFVDAMKAAQSKGIKFVCTSTVLSASMAFIIYAQCDERYALPNTRLLFHPMSISVNGARVKDLYVDLKHTVKEEEAIKITLQGQLGIDDETFEENYLAETFWQAALLAKAAPGFVTIVDNVEGWGEWTYQYRLGNQITSGKVQEILDRLEGRR